MAIAAGTETGPKVANPANAALAAAHAYIDFALAEPELYHLMYGLGGVRTDALRALVTSFLT